MRQADFSDKAPGKLVPATIGTLAFLPEPAPTSLAMDRETKSLNERALLALGRLQAIIPSLPNPALVTTPFMRREAVLSSKIEGTRTGLSGLFLFEESSSHGESGHKPLSEDDADAQEVLNYVLAQSIGYDILKEMPVCFRLMSAMHARLMEGIPNQRGFDKQPGMYRTTQAYIGHDDFRLARYVAPPAESVEQLMADLERFINEPNELPTLVSIAIAHYQFEAIHPFYDGNGRLGRLLISMQLAATNILEDPLLYLSAYFERNKAEYIHRLWRISANGEWSEWIRFFLVGVISEADDAVSRSRSLLELRENYRRQLQANRRSGSQTLQLLDSLFRWPILSVNKAAELLGISHQAATPHVNALVKLGIVTEATGFTRNRNFVAFPIIELVS